MNASSIATSLQQSRLLQGKNPRTAFLADGYIADTHAKYFSGANAAKLCLRTLASPEEENTMQTATPAASNTQPANPNKALWEKGDFTRIAETMRASGEALVGKLGIKKGMKVLDLGCGDGTTAIPAAQRGAEVLGVDIARNLVAAGNRRAKELGLSNVRFQEGDACDLQGVPDKGFDMLVSIFGAMFAPKPQDVANAMVRVVKPGGRIVMGNWIPNDPTLVAQILKISSAYTPPPPAGFVSPMTWGNEATVTERFTAAGVPANKISFERDTFTFDMDGAPSDLVARFRDFYGPTMNAFDAANKNGKVADLQRELDALFAAQNKSGRADHTTIAATYLRVTVTI
jgi:2-polyprenyl-3-methyl-5-hydroxy-6-metoxy-1,4-benzoquinol methylase